MILMNEIMIALFLTTATGSLVLVVWYVVGFVLDRIGYLNILYRFLQMLPLFYFVPITYLIFVLENAPVTLVGGLFPATTPEMRNALTAVGAIWLAGMAVQMIRRRREKRWVSRITKDSRPCSAEEREIFERMLERMGIRSGRVALRRSPEIPFPCLCGIRRPVVFLPEEKLPAQVLEVALIHELTHYRHRDLIFKRLASWLTVLYWFNPFAHLFAVLAENWSEYACDYDVLRESVGLKRYICALMGAAERTRETEGSHFTTSAFLERRSMMYKRIRRMDRYRRRRPRRIIFILLCMALLVGSSLSVVAASQGAKAVYGEWYDATEVLSAETVEAADEDLTEYEEVMTEEDWANMEIDTSSAGLARASSGTFSWTVKADKMKCTNRFYATTDKTITVTAILDPSDVYARVGLITPSGVKRYVKIKDSGKKTFTLTEKGYYYVFAENCYSSEKLSVDGAYKVRSAS